MFPFPKLNFPAPQLQLQRRGEKVYVVDRRRGQRLVLTPEEWVRQHLIAFMCSSMACPEQAVATEYPVLLNGQNQRADAVVVKPDGKVWLLAECKAPDVTVTQAVMDQAVRYNSVLGAEWIILTNGLTHFCFHFDGADYSKSETFPNFRD